MKSPSTYPRVKLRATSRLRVLTHPWLKISSSRTRYIKAIRTRSNASTHQLVTLTHISSMLAQLQQVHRQSCKIRRSINKMLPVDKPPHQNGLQPSLPPPFLRRHPSSRSWRKALHHPTMFHASALLKTITAWPYPLNSRIHRALAKGSLHLQVLHLHLLRLFLLNICKIQCKLCTICRGNSSKG